MVMERRQLGRTRLRVPAIGMGTWQSFDTGEDRRPIVEEALRAGIYLFDSSPMYGLAEDTLARALSGRRDEAIIATKIWTSSESQGRAEAAHALELFGRVDILAQAVLKWIATDHRVSCVLTATRRPGRPTEAAAAGDPPWFDESQRARLARHLG